MKKLILILIVLSSCKPSCEVIVNKTMISSKDLEFQFKVNPHEIDQIIRLYKRHGMYIFYKKEGNGYIVYMTLTQIEATRGNKGKCAILPEKYDKRIRKAIIEEIGW